jgi:enterochelin esterase-like enzyme
VKRKLCFFLFIVLLLSLSVFAFAAPQEVDYQKCLVRWDGKLSDKDFTGEEFAALTKTTVYQSDKSPTGFFVTFRYYGPDQTRVRVAGEWMFSTRAISTVFSSALIHPKDWYNGCILHIGDPWPSRPFDDMTLNKDTGYWFYTIPLPSGTYCYQFYVGEGDPTGAPVSGHEQTSQFTSDPQNLPAERVLGDEVYSQVLVPYDPVKQSLSPDYSQYQDICEQKGTLLFELVPSEVAGTDTPVGIYLPHGYNPRKEGGYPYLILAHGGGSHGSIWTAQGMMPNITDNLIAAGLVKPMIVVTPTIRDSKFNWLSSNTNPDGSLITEGKQVSQAQPYILNELIPWLEEHYNVSKDPKDRAISGLSAGGMFTSNMYIHCPEEFGYFYMMSGANANIAGYDLSRPELKTPVVAFGTGIYDSLLFRMVYPVQEAFTKAGIEFRNTYQLGAHRMHVWRELYIDLLSNVLWKPKPEVHLNR